MSSRHTRSFFGVMLAVVFALSAVIVAPASAKLTKAQKVHIRHQLRKAIHKNPKLIRSKSFIKKASLVNFKLPVTIKLRNYKNVADLADPTTANPNAANIDLGASLGQREIDLGGSLAAEIVFHDSFDGGALGNVDINILNGPKALTSTSIPLLWNDQVNQGNWDAALTGVGTVGCGDFTTTTANATSLVPGQPDLPVHTALGTAPGFPTTDGAGNPTGDYVPVTPGVDSIDNLKAYKIPGNDDYLGGNPFPFPASPGPGNDPNAPITTTPSVQNTVLRTTALALTVAQPGTDVNQSTGSGVNGSQDVVIGKSGGQANLFGDIPGKPGVGVDVTVSLATKINSILRAVDVDTQHLTEGASWPSALFNCRQAITGYVQNYIPGVRLQGKLKISPAITPNGDLRIAKVSLSSPSGFSPTHVSLAACLSPYSALNGENNSTDSVPTTVPVGPSGPYAIPLGPTAFLLPNALLPANPLTRRDSGAAGTTGQIDHTFVETKAGACDSTQTQLTQDAGFAGLPNADTNNGYTVTNDGSKVSVAGDLTVKDVEADVLIGDN